MKNLLRLEELAQFLICLAALILSDVPWWVYGVLLIGPDIGMIGYLVNARAGAITYNLLHHKGVALIVLLLGVVLPRGGTIIDMPLSMYHGGIVAGIILFGHSSMDRMLGFGLKYGDDFKHTHLGWIRKGPEGSRQEQ